MKRFFFPILVVFLAVFFHGCDLFNSPVDEGQDSSSGYVPVGAVYPNTFMMNGRADYGLTGVFQLTAPGFQWPESAVGPYLHVISGVNIYTFQAISYELADDGQSIAVLPVGWPGEPVSGTVFWNTENMFQLHTIQTVYVDDAVWDDILTAVGDSWDLTEEEAGALIVQYIGGSDPSLLFWVAEPPESHDGDFDPDAAEKLMGPVLVQSNSITVEASFAVPGGSWLYDFQLADLNGNGLADLVGIQLQGDGAPTYGYIRDTSGSWRWVMR